MLECGKMDCNVIEMVELLYCEDNGRPSVDFVGNIHDSDPRICVNCPTATCASIPKTVSKRYSGISGGIMRT